MAGEASTTEIVKTLNSKGFLQNKKAVKQGGLAAGNATKELAIRTGKKIVNPEKLLSQLKKRKKLKAHKNSGKQKQPVRNVNQPDDKLYGTGYKFTINKYQTSQAKPLTKNSLQAYSIIFANYYESKTRYIYYFTGSNRRPGA